MVQHLAYALRRPLAAMPAFALEIAWPDDAPRDLQPYALAKHVAGRWLAAEYADVAAPAGGAPSGDLCADALIDLQAMAMAHEYGKGDPAALRDPAWMLPALEAQPALLSLEELRQGRVLVAASGGKESTAIIAMLEHFGIVHDAIAVQEQRGGEALRRREDGAGILVNPWQMTAQKPGGQEFADRPGFPLPLMAFNGLALAAYAAGAYDFVLLGGELERQQMFFTADGNLNPTRSLHLSQHWWNFVSGLPEVKTRFVCPLMNFSQVAITRKLLAERRVFCSCVRSPDVWCGACAKCGRVGEIMRAVAPDFAARLGNAGAVQFATTQRFRDDPYRMLAAVRPQPGWVPWNAGIAAYLERLAADRDWRRNGHHVRDTRVKLWDEASLDAIVGWMEEGVDG